MIEFLTPVMDARTPAVQVALSGVCVCCVALMAARLLRRRSEPLRYGILFAGVLGLLACPALVGLGQHVPTTWFRSVAPPEDEIVRIPAEMLPELLDRPEPLHAPAFEEPAAASLVGPIVIASLLALWALGTAVGLYQLAFAVWNQRRIILGERWRADFWTEERQDALAQKLGLRKFPDVHLSPVAPMPMVVGLWRPAIVLPEQAPATWTQTQWEAVLLHEAAHIARRDPWAALAQRVAVLLFWWCPPAHWLDRRLHELRENICDDCALEGPCDQIAYAELLLEAAERLVRLKAVPVPLGLLNSARCGLEARITRLLKKEKRLMSKLSLPGKLLGGLVLVAGCLLTTAGAALSGPQAAPEKKVQIKILVDGKEIDLSDPRLGGILEGAQKKPAVAQPFQVLGRANANEGAVFSIVLDEKDLKDPKKKGEIGVRLSPPAPGARTDSYELIAQIVTKPDPRVEDLVKQAEAIKKGSGEAIRRALLGEGIAARTGVLHLTTEPRAAYGAVVVDGVAKTPPPDLIRAIAAPDGKKPVILIIQDGKVQQLSEQDLKKLTGAGTHTLRVEAPKATVTKPNPAVLYERTVTTAPKAAIPHPPVAAPAGGDIDALRRQLERLTVELNDLRRRLEAEKK